MALDEAAAEPGVEQQLVTEHTVPEELVIVDDTEQEYFADPQAALRPRRRDKPLGLGIGVTLLGPYVLAVATPVMPYNEVGRL